MCFDVPKIVWSPGYDHGHDEESRNGRDMKIDILDDYIRHRNGSGGYRIYTGVPGFTGTPPEVIGPHVPKWWKRRGGQGAAVHPSPPQVRIGQGGGGAPPF